MMNVSTLFSLLVIDKNQYVHRRDSVSVTSLSEQEIQRRIQLGFITPSLHGHASVAAAAATVADQTQSEEEWQDITDQDVMQDSADVHDDDPTEGSMDDHNIHPTPYLLDTQRRSSIDLGHLSFNRHDETVLALNHNSTTGHGHGTNETAATIEPTSGPAHHHHYSNKRLRYRQSSIASISEEEQVPTASTNNNNSSILMDNDDDDEVATVDGNDEDIMEDI